MLTHVKYILRYTDGGILLQMVTTKEQAESTGFVHPLGQLASHKYITRYGKFIDNFLHCAQTLHEAVNKQSDTVHADILTMINDTINVDDEGVVTVCDRLHVAMQNVISFFERANQFSQTYIAKYEIYRHESN